MHILVLGGNGFIGSHFVAHAASKGHEISVLSRKKMPAWSHKYPFHHLQGTFETLAMNPQWLDGVDAVCHAAWSTVPKTAAADPISDVETNIIGTIKVLELLNKAPSVKHLVFLSSGGAIYGNAHGTQFIREDHMLNPISAYGIGKLAAEKYCQTLSGSDLNVTIIRPSNPYGAGQMAYGDIGVISTFVHLIMTGQPIFLFGDGSAVRDFLDVHDLAELMLAAFEGPCAGIYNCGSGSGVSIAEIVSVIESVTDKKASITHLPARAFDPQHIVLDVSKAQDAFGWRTKIGLREGVANLVENYVQGS